MNTQIFKNKIPNEMVRGLLDSLCIKEDKYYIFHYETYKKGMFTNAIPDFVQQCKLYYHTSKQFYLNRKLNYNNFITVLRQICNANSITYTSVIKYDKSDYSIIYHIHL